MSGVVELLTNNATTLSSVWRSSVNPQEILATMSLAQGDIVIQRDGQPTSATTTATTPAVVVNGNGVLSIPLTASDLNFTGYATIIVSPPAALAQRFRVNVVSKLSTARLHDIEVDTNDLQTDWADGGRLDNILDARMPTTHIAATGGKVNGVATVDTCIANTDMRGTDNAMLAASYVAPANADITAIKNKTEKIPDNPAVAGGQVSLSPSTQVALASAVAELVNSGGGGTGNVPVTVAGGELIVPDADAVARINGTALMVNIVAEDTERRYQAVLQVVEVSRQAG